MRGILAAAAFCGLVGGAVGCAHMDQARANYHERKAERAAEHGRFGKAAREERKAQDAQRDADTDPLP